MLVNFFFVFFRLFGMMVAKIFVADLQKVSGSNERKICAVGVSKILTECKNLVCV